MTDREQRVSRRRTISNIVGLVLLAATFGWSLVYVARQAFFAGGSPLTGEKKTIVFAHWQLEGRTVEAVEWAAAEYMKLHPDVRIEQIAIPTTAYDQWVRTQLIGRTAPDLIEMWVREDWDELAVRYFLPLAEVVDAPNPYNAGTDLEGVPWRRTYIDDMRGGFRLTLQEYYAAPLSVFTVRIYANRDLLDAVAAHSGGAFTPPKTLREFMALCEDVKAYGRDTGRRIAPIAGSDAIAGQFKLRYFTMGAAGLNDRLDLNLDGDIEAGVALEAILTGKLDLVEDPHLRAAHMVQYEIGRHFNQGFMGVKRDQSISLFAQGKAAMIATGSWEAGSLYRQIDGDFEIAVFDFPVAAPDNPDYGRTLARRVSEAGQNAGFPMGLTRFSRHPEIALDFMRFLTSRKMNEQINRRFRWFPAVRGAAVDEVLEGFRPRVEGVYAAFLLPSLHPGARTQLSYEQKLAAYVSRDEPRRADYERFLTLADDDDRRDVFRRSYGSLADAYLDFRAAGSGAYDYGRFIRDWWGKHYRDFMNAYAADYRRLAMGDFLRMWRNRYRSIVRSEAGVAAARIRALRAGAVDAPPEAVRRNLQALIHGQVTRTLARAADKRRYDAMAELLADEEGERR